jgi:hypothetical protein
MTVKKIPMKYLFTCNLCELEVEQESDISKPSHWSRLALFRDAHDYSGAAVANADIKLDLCQPCTKAIVTAINSVKSIGTNIK